MGKTLEHFSSLTTFSSFNTPNTFTMVSIKSLVLSTALLVAGASAGAIEKRGGGWGTATYYYQNGNPGACGNYASDSDYVVALNSAEYDGGAHCGKTIWVQSNESKKIVEAKIADLCPSC